jgi:hypothetical protein
MHRLRWDCLHTHKRAGVARMRKAEFFASLQNGSLGDAGRRFKSLRSKIQAACRSPRGSGRGEKLGRT